jgi:hypothetical protein
MADLDELERVKENYRPLKAGRADVGARRGLAARPEAETAETWEARVAAAASGRDPLEAWKGCVAFARVRARAAL